MAAELEGGGVNQRLDGWKSIAAHFNRDRTTAIRWARDRGMPVYRIPGGRTGTVYAFRHELDRWAGAASSQLTESGGTSAAAPEQQVSVHVPQFPRRLIRLGIAASATLPIAAIAMGMLISPSAISPLSAPGVPADPALATRFLAARDLAADRSAEGLERAIRLLEDLVRRNPDFAPVQVALGEALVLSREFGRRSDADAFAGARIPARAAVRLDPQLAAGHRLMGFIAYWRDGDLAEAKARFRKALALDDGDSMTHFWLGNILSDHGDHAAGLAELDRARLLQPGSVAIRTDFAWALWMSGEGVAASRELREIVARHPDFAVAQDCLAIIALLEGRPTDYVDHFSTFARLRGDAKLLARAQRLTAVRSAPVAVLHGMILRHALEDIAAGNDNRLWAVTVASIARDRARVMALLQDAERHDERWGGSGFVDRVRAIWQDDRAILNLIDRRKQFRIA